MRTKTLKQHEEINLHVKKKSLRWLWLLFVIPLYFISKAIQDYQLSAEEAAKLADLLRWLFMLVLIGITELFILWRLNKLKTAFAFAYAVAVAVAFATATAVAVVFATAVAVVILLEEEDD